MIVVLDCLMKYREGCGIFLLNFYVFVSLISVSNYIDFWILMNKLVKEVGCE